MGGHLTFNPLPVQFKSLLHGRFFQWAFKFTYVPVRLSMFSSAGDIKSSTFWYVRAGKGLTGVKDCAFASHGGSCVDELCNDCEGVEEENKHDLELVASFAEACVPYKTVK
jgi:hypothetical protein